MRAARSSPGPSCCASWSKVHYEVGGHLWRGARQVFGTARQDSERENRLRGGVFSARSPLIIMGFLIGSAFLGASSRWRWPGSGCATWSSPFCSLRQAACLSCLSHLSSPFSWPRVPHHHGAACLPVHDLDPGAKGQRRTGQRVAICARIPFAAAASALKLPKLIRLTATNTPAPRPGASAR